MVNFDVPSVIGACCCFGCKSLRFSNIAAAQKEGGEIMCDLPPV